MLFIMFVQLLKFQGKDVKSLLEIFNAIVICEALDERLDPEGNSEKDA